MKAKVMLGGILFSIIFVLFLSTKLFTVLDAGEVMVIQYPNGSLGIFTEPGFYGEWFGTVTRYKRREQYSFSNKMDQGNTIDQSLKIQFNDGGSARISGVVNWEMPLTPDKIRQMHQEFRSQIGVDQQLIRPAIENAMFMTGPLMSSTESAGERRSELLQFITDQAQYGIYRVERAKKKIIDISGQEKEIVVGEIMMKDAHPVREADSPLKTFGITMLPATINEIVYDPKVQAQIDKRQEQITEVQTAIAQAKKAEQQAITVAKQGEAAAAEAKWKQEVIKAKEVTQAEQERAVAELTVKTADLRKRAAELEGEGEGAKRRAIMSADGGLEKKLDAYVKVQAIWADAFKSHQGNMVPSIVMGGQSATGNAVTNTTNLVDLLTIKSAKDLALDLGIKQGATSQGQQAPVIRK
jgi:regulator of protease activity HflC (stomatin/prohibitin superfamily)